MNQTEFDNGTGSKMRSQSVDCFCGCGMSNVQAHAWVETDEQNLAWCDSIEFRVRVDAYHAQWLMRIWARLVLAWHVLLHGELTVAWVEGKVADWHEMAKWLLTINSVTEERRQEVLRAEAEEIQRKRQRPWWRRLLGLLVLRG